MNWSYTFLKKRILVVSSSFRNLQAITIFQNIFYRISHHIIPVIIVTSLKKGKCTQYTVLKVAFCSHLLNNLLQRSFAGFFLNSFKIQGTIRYSWSLYLIHYLIDLEFIDLILQANLLNQILQIKSERKIQILCKKKYVNFLQFYIYYFHEKNSSKSMYKVCMETFKATKNIEHMSVCVIRLFPWPWLRAMSVKDHLL